LYGKTYGKITEISATNTYNKGIDVPKTDKFRTTTIENYTDQLGKPVYHLKPKPVAQPPEPLGSDIPSDIQNKFWGIKDQGAAQMSEFDKAATSFYAGAQRKAGPDMS
jgi:hypothetical protein